MPARKSPHRGRLLKPPLTLGEIRTWAEQYYKRHGEWPTGRSGPIPGTRETWNSVVKALGDGWRGLPRGKTLARLLDDWFSKLRPRPYLRPPLTVKKIVQWAKEHRRQTGRWPTSRSGRVLGHPEETWLAIESALFAGQRGLPGGADTVVRVLRRSVSGYSLLRKRGLTLAQIRTWAKTHRVRCGEWPSANSGRVVGGDGTTWSAVDMALRYGYRGLARGSSLIALLGLPNHQRPPRLTIEQILDWADEHHERTGEWPVASAALVPHLRPPTTWHAVHSALLCGARGLPGGSTLARLLAKHRGVPLHKRYSAASEVYHHGAPVPKVSIRKILACADQHRRKTGKWPTSSSGPVEGLPLVAWLTIDKALQRGAWGLLAGGSLSKLLIEQRGARRHGFLPPLSEEQVLEWADAFYKRRGSWPNSDSGPIPESPGETWNTVYRALRNGLRGMTGPTTVGAFLGRHHRQRRGPYSPRLSEAEITTWARTHYQRTGDWPTSASGVVAEAPYQTWQAVNCALSQGMRGLPGGKTLPQLVATIGEPNPRGAAASGPSAGRRVRGRRRPSTGERPQRRLFLREIVMWARAHHRRTGAWPERYTGRILDAPGETWLKVDEALRQGGHGLPGGSSLKKMLARKRAPAPIATLLAKPAGRRRRI